jgi:hypothetical protein
MNHTYPTRLGPVVDVRTGNGYAMMHLQSLPLHCVRTMNGPTSVQFTLDSPLFSIDPTEREICVTGGLYSYWT